jgi:hypothetical protein
MSESPENPAWLLLLHQMPAKPAYARVKTWRRLQALGAVTVKNSVYALPNNSETREDMAWLVKEIGSLGGEAVIVEAQLVEGMSDADLRALFIAARDEDYARLAEELRTLHAKRQEEEGEGALAEIATQATRLRKQLAEIAAIDFFAAPKRAEAERLLAGLEAHLQEGEGVMDRGSEAQKGALGGKVWVTRQGVQIDRIASAWLIRRFIDAQAQFKFVPGRAYVPRSNEVRFDMFEGEYTHEGDKCTFEVLLQCAGLDNPALNAIGEIIHDIDLKDGKYGREETAGIRTIMSGIAAAHAEDGQRLARGAAVLDDLYEFQKSAAGTEGKR